ncbi:leukocyte elastase inhibitor [Denticeps clupeoides]|uniref:leukocyte elastase inhibitor n=1 Tax=Denticeps clupeoides TaxID=299321 RepID=UPI0010A2E8B1|nr:leukocyte elastase inhibitor A-like [Denticeps clupeoides]
MDTLSQANGAFALHLYRALSDAGGSLFFSPLSISATLAMVQLGARTHTEKELGEVLRFKQVPDLHSHFQHVVSEISAPTSSHLLKAANRLYGEITFSFLPNYLSSVLKHYHAELQEVDFVGAAEQTRLAINKWVQDNTEGKVRELLKSGMVSAMTRLALVNAVYFKGSWMHQFNKEETKEMPFKINQNVSRPVQMMFQVKKLPLRFIPEQNLQVLELPYEKETLSMFIVLPNESKRGADPLIQLQEDLSIENILDWTDRSKMDVWTDVVVRLPRFRLEQDFSLVDTLVKMGVASLFDEGVADLSGMAGGRGLFVSALAHSAVCEVGEEGTEAAAATGAVASFCMMREEHFTADHPFLFLITHNPTRSILFLGRYCGPP